MILLAQRAAARGRLEAWFERCGDGLLLCDDEGWIVAANDAACDVYGIERDEILGEHLADLRAPRWECYGSREDDDEWLDRLARGETVEDEWLVEHGDGSVRLLRLVGVPNLFAGGLSLTIVRDLTRDTGRGAFPLPFPFPFGLRLV